MLASIRSDIDDIEKLSNETLRYAQFEHSAPVLQRMDLDLLSAVQANVARYQHQTGIRFTLVIASDARLHFDPDCLARVLQNLIDNALRYARSEIRIAWQQDANSWCLSVEDDGPGLMNGLAPSTPHDENQDHASAEIKYAEKSEREPGHYGLGLAIVKKIALWHGAQLQLENSQALGGARVSLIG